MKTIILGTLLCLAAASLAATAQTLPPEHTVTVPGNALRIDVPEHPRYMMRQDCKKFVGTYDLQANTFRRNQKGDESAQDLAVTGPDDKLFDELLPRGAAETWREEVFLASEGLKPFDLEAFREGHLTPLYFGAALRDYGVRDLIDALGALAPSPRAQTADKRTIQAGEPKMTGFVFKIQANMDPNHRDRIAFMRVCSGKLSRGMKAKLVRTGKPMPLNAPQFFFARDRSIAEEAFAGDIVGLPNHGTLRIGDTLTEGEDVVFKGVPSFAPEILRRVKLKDAMKAKKLREALQQMAEEGVVQIFLPHDGAPAIVGVVGALQLDVLKARLEAEYSLPVEFEVSEFQLARWVSSEDRKKLDTFLAANTSSIADDVDGDPVYLARNEFYLGYARERAEGIEFTNVKDVKKKG